MASITTQTTITSSDIMKLPVNYDEIPQRKRREVREAYIEIQANQCHLCKAELTKHPAKHIRAKPVRKALFPKGFFKNPVHLHHDHNSGMTIGAVHAYCNAVLWQYHGE